MLPTFLQRTFAKPFRLLMCASVAVALTACGGGGGNPGTTPGGATPGTPVPATVTLSTSASTMPGSGADGTEVTLTVIVKDSGNNALAGVTVAFNASSGTVSNTNRVTDATGTVVEKLSTKGDATTRTITVTASAGSITSAAKTVDVTASTAVPPRLLLTASSGTLPSAGAAGTEVEIRALAIDANNVVVPGANVTFVADSGTLSASSAVTNASGVATVKLSTGFDPTTRSITVTASAVGTPASTVKVNVVGTKITLNSATTLNTGAVVDVTAVLSDSLGNPLANRAMTFGALTNSIAVKGGGAAITDSVGKLVLSYTASQAAVDKVTVTALGETASVTVTTVSADFTVKAVNSLDVALTEANTETCNKVLVRNFLSGAALSGSVTLSSSRGTVYSDAACTTALGGMALTLSSGQAIAYVKATSPGIATLSATYSVNSSTVQSTVEFVAPLTSVAVIALQATPAIVGANTGTGSTQQSVLRAVVTDRASQGNPVKGAKVAFSVIADSSGGSLSQPSEVLTGADGSATVSYIAGTTTTAVDGVVIQAQVQSGISTANTTVKLTVAQRSLFISAGTGNTILSPTSSTYQVDYSVFVTDSAGNAVPNVTITGAVRPRNYRKGVMVLATTSGPWVPSYSAICLNEDADSDGVLGIGEDTNANGRLDPVIPMNITPSVVTNASGTATVSLTYPKDRANWLDVDFTIRGAVSGSEARYVGYTVLPGLAADYKDTQTAPPGAVSPYGKSTVCTNDL